MRPLVLLAEHDRDLREALRDALRSRGWEVVEAADGAETLDAVADAVEGYTARPYVIVVDARTPAMSLESACLGVHAKHPSTHTDLRRAGGSVTPSEENAIVALGAARLFRKPVDYGDLERALWTAREAAKSDRV